MHLSFDGKHYDIAQTEIELDRHDCAESLAKFVKLAWHVVEPGQEYVHGWHVDFVCAHLEAIANEAEFDDGSVYNRLLVNIPPGMSKSVLTGVFLPAWIWGPLNKPHKRIICASHMQELAIRDGLRMRRLVESEWYQARWGDRVTLTKDQNQKTKFENTALGFRQAVAAGSITGARADLLIIDDPLSVDGAASDQIRQTTENWFLESVPTRLNNPKRSAIVVIMQRLHECLLPGTLVRVPEGERPIETIKPGDQVYGLKGWQAVVAAAHHDYSGTAYGVTVYNHPTVCWTTANHEYLTERGWVRADHLTKDDWVFLPAPPASASEIKWEEPLYADPPKATGAFTGVRLSLGAASVLDRSDLERYAAQGLTNTRIAEITGVHRNTVQCHMSHYGLRRVKDRSPVFGDSHLSDPDFWRLVGYWIAEGCFISGRNASCGVRLTFGPTEQEYCDDVIAIAARYGMNATVQYPPSAIQPQIHCSQLARWLEKNFGRGSHNLRLPEFVFGLPKECQENLLQGWFLGDGCCRNGELAATSVSHGLIHDFQRLLLRMGCNTRVVPSYVGPKANIIAGRMSVSSGRAREVRFLRTEDPRSKMRLVEGGAWVKVRMIETKPYSGMVYDIETPSHDFVVGNATVHNCDISGVIIDKQLGYDHICLPMRFEPGRSTPTMLGYEDPRTEEGELLFPERFPLEVVERDEKVMGPYATAGQFQQSPEPRGGGIIKRDWWQLWEKKEYPHFDYIVASLDTAYTTKAENDPSAMTVWGVWSGGDQMAQVTRVIRPGAELDAMVERQYTQEHPKVMLMYAWAERLELHDLVERVRETMLRYGVDRLLIENKAAGHSVAQELRRVYGHDDFGVQMYDPKTLDKMARLYSVQHLFADGLVFTPEKQWSDMVINQCAQFPRAKHDDLVDTVSMGLKHLRDTGILLRKQEHTANLDDARSHLGSPPPPLYPS